MGALANLQANTLALAGVTQTLSATGDLVIAALKAKPTGIAEADVQAQADAVQHQTDLVGSVAAALNSAISTPPPVA